MDVGGLADAHGVEIVLVDVADDPDVGKIGDGERIRAGKPLHASRIGDLLVGDDAGDGRDDVDDAGGMIFVDAERRSCSVAALRSALASASAASACSRALWRSRLFRKSC